MSSTEPIMATSSHRAPPRLVPWLMLFVAGLGLWLLYLGGQLGPVDAGRAWRALLMAFLYIAPLGAGLMTWSAVVLASRGRWAGSFERLTLAGIGLAAPSLAALLTLWAASPHWAPWYQETMHQGRWLDNNFIFIRGLAGLLIFWGLAGWYLRRRLRGQGSGIGGWLIVTYLAVFSMIGFDFIMALAAAPVGSGRHGWHSSLFGGYFAVSGMYIALAAWTLMAARRPDPTGHRWHDLGKLLVALSLLTTYMMFSQLIVIWYGNLPGEAGLVAPRMKQQWWSLVSAALVATVYLGPLVLLLTVRAKRNRWWLGAVALLVLAGLGVERWWLVAPHYQPRPELGLPELALAAAFVGLAALSINLALRRLPAELPVPEVLKDLDMWKVADPGPRIEKKVADR